MTNDILLFAAAQLKKYCKEQNDCKNCMFAIKDPHLDIYHCRLDTTPRYFNINDITGER